VTFSAEGILMICSFALSLLRDKSDSVSEVVLRLMLVNKHISEARSVAVVK
jgi:hypothetical protein